MIICRSSFTSQCDPAQAMFGFKSKTEEAAQAARPGLFKRLREKLNRGNSWLTYDLANLLPAGRIDDTVLDELETRLITADVGVETTERILDELRRKVARKELDDLDALLAALRSSLLDVLRPSQQPLTIERNATPFAILVVGVNGAGKTTTIGKLARELKQEGLKVMLAAGDTFRAAAVEQLQIWGDRNDVTVIAQATGADPAAVVFDALQAARARRIDVLLADTAGRLHTQSNLMDELKKVKRVMARVDERAPHEVLLVLDASQGQNALQQARLFNDALGVTGIVLTKLDGTAKGGIVFAIASQLRLPIRYIGIGESAEDFAEFDAESVRRRAPQTRMIRFDHVFKRYPNGREALSDLSLEIAAGEIVFVTGHSGAGKSSLLKLISLIERPSRGQLIVNGQNVAGIGRGKVPAYRRQIGMVFQDHKLLHDRTIFDNVALPLIIAGVGTKEIGKRVRAALDQVGLLGREQSAPLELSTGEQQRVGIARAVVSKPRDPHRRRADRQPRSGSVARSDEDLPPLQRSRRHGAGREPRHLPAGAFPGAPRAARSRPHRRKRGADGRRETARPAQAPRRGSRERSRDRLAHAASADVDRLARPAGAAQAGDDADDPGDRHRARAAGVPASAGGERADRDRQLESRSRSHGVPQATDVGGGSAAHGRANPSAARRGRGAADPRRRSAEGIPPRLRLRRRDRCAERESAAAHDRDSPRGGVHERGEPAKPRRRRPRAAVGRSRATGHGVGQSAQRDPGGVSARAWSSRPRVLGLGVMVIVGNTIRLDIQNRRDEIEVTKLVGGSDAFVRRPFLYNGFWYGLGGAFTAWVITLVAIAVLREPIGRLAGLYGSSFQLGALGPEASAVLLLSGVALGWLGSYIAATRHLRKIEPT